MNKNCKKSIALLISAMVVVGTTFSAFADTTNTANETKQERKVPENMIIGKITAIDATNVTIQVATRKEMEKKENGEKGNPPEMTEEMKPKMQNGEKLQALNMDDFYTLTGETKTINISSADLGKSIDFKDFKPEDNNSQSQDQKQKMEDMFKNAKAKTYQDYKVGDYITIECTDSTYKTAKTVNDGNMMGGGFRGFVGKDFKKKDENK